MLSTAAVGLAPTDAEQYMLELVNLARANPAAMGARLVALAQTDPVLEQATAGENLGLFLQTIDAKTSEPPLAFDTSLVLAATNHSAAMLAANSQFHSPDDYLTNPADAAGTGGQAYYPVGQVSWATGENIFAYSANVDSTSDTVNADYLEDGFLLDWGNPDFGHLQNVLAPGPGEWSPGDPHAPYSEIGIGLLTGVSPTVAPPTTSAIPGNQGLNVGPDIVTQEFGWRSGDPILTGVFYVDKAGTDFYAPGEGYGGATVTAVGSSGQGTFQTTTWSTGGYSLPLPPGRYTVTASGGGMSSAVTTTVTLGQDNVEWDHQFAPTVADLPVPGDYLGNGQTQIAVYRPSTAQWFIAGAGGPISFGEPGVDIPEPGDYDGVGHDEIAVYRPTTGQWFVRGPHGTETLGVFGGTGDIPEPGDYDLAGRTEAAVYRPGTAQWFVLGSNGVGRVLATFGAPNTDIPEPANYDGTGRDEPAVYRPSTGQWFALGPHGSHAVATLGGGDDIPVPGDYDRVGRDEPAVYAPDTAQWMTLGPAGLRVVSYGAAGLDVPLRGDFDGDGKADLAVYRPTTATWYMRGTTAGAMSRQYGMGGTSVPVTTWVGTFAQHPTALLSELRATPDATTESGGTGLQKPLIHALHRAHPDATATHSFRVRHRRRPA